MTRFVWLPRLAALALVPTFVLACAFLTGTGLADDSVKEEETLPADLKLVPADSGMFAAVRVADLLASDAGKKLLPAVHKMFGQLSDVEKVLGVSLEDIERLTVIGSSDPAHEGIGGLIVRTVKVYDLEKVTGPNAEKTKVEGKTVYKKSGGLIYPVDKQTFVFCAQTRLAAVLKAAQGKQEHPLAEALKRAGKHHVTLAAQPEAIIRSARAQREAQERRIEKDLRDRLEKDKKPRDNKDEKPGASEPINFVQEEKKEKKAEKADYEDLLDELTLEREMAVLLPYRSLFLARWVVVTADIGKEISIAAAADFKDADTAKDGEAAVRTALYVARTFIQRLMKKELSERMPAALRLEKPLVAGLKAAKVQRDGTKINASVSMSVDAELLASVAKDLYGQATAVQAQNHFKMIGLAMHSYHDANGALPAAAICDKNGKPLLSWRVAILPYIEEDALYRQFKLDEPWDSKHNKALLKKMPKIYAPTVGTTKEPHSTYYRVFTGKEALFPTGTNKGRRFTEITDGTSNTIMVVEAAQEVPWTKPDELAFDSQKALPKLGGQFPGRFMVAMCDGSVRMVRLKVSEDTLKAVITYQGGEVPGKDWD